MPRRTRLKINRGGKGAKRHRSWHRQGKKQVAEIAREMGVKTG